MTMREESIRINQDHLPQLYPQRTKMKTVTWK